MSEINETVHNLTIEQDINAAVPADSPCVWLTRDVCYGVMARFVDVWTKAPKRTAHGERDMRCVEFTDAAPPNENSTLLGRFTSAQCLDRFGFVPSGDECISVDNPRVN